MAAKKHCYDYPRPMLTADIVLFTLIDGRLSTLLIRRRHDPYSGCWAFPGGFVDEYESLDVAAKRELLEETGVSVESLRYFGAFGEAGRDPRGWTVTVSYYAVVGNAAMAVAGDDAASVAWKSATRPPKLAFDHPAMLKSATAMLREDLFRAAVARPLLDDTFTSEILLDTYSKLGVAVTSGKSVLKRLLANEVVQRVKRGQYRFADSR